MDADDQRGSPRERAKAYLRKMLRTASLVTAAGCSDDVADPVPEPTTSDSGRDTESGTTTHGSGSTTWDDPCAEDGCDPPPPPETSTGVDADTGTGTETGTDSGTDTGTGTSTGSTGGSTGG